MGILDRVSTLVRANINDLIDRAEDPEKIINQLLADMNNQLLQVKTQVAASIADEKQLQQRWQENQQKADDWHNKAELAVEKGQDDLAREALARYNSFQQTADGFHQQYEQQSQQVETLKDALHKLEAKIQEAQTKKDLLIARSRRAKAETQIRTTLSGMDASGSLASFDRMEQKVNQQEARAAALGELDTDTTEQRFQLLEQESAIDQQLAALKAKKGLGPAAEAPALGSGSESEPSASPGVPPASGSSSSPS
jgi:phage shock protein A